MRPSDPNTSHVEASLRMLDFLVVQDIFMTETAHYADVILPASAFPEKTGTFTNTDRRVQLGRQAIDPPGEARQDLDVEEFDPVTVGLESYSITGDYIGDGGEPVPFTTTYSEAIHADEIASLQ